MVVGVTVVDGKVVVKPLFEYQTGLPIEQDALKVELTPEQTAGGLAATPVGERGV